MFPVPVAKRVKAPVPVVFVTVLNVISPIPVVCKTVPSPTVMVSAVMRRWLSSVVISALRKTPFPAVRVRRPPAPPGLLIVTGLSMVMLLLACKVTGVP